MRGGARSPAEDRGRSQRGFRDRLMRHSSPRRHIQHSAMQHEHDGRMAAGRGEYVAARLRLPSGPRGVTS